MLVNGKAGDRAVYSPLGPTEVTCVLMEDDGGFMDGFVQVMWEDGTTETVRSSSLYSHDEAARLRESR